LGRGLKAPRNQNRLIQLILALGVYFSATAGTYACANLFPGLQESFLRWVPPLIGTWLPLAWAYTFSKVPEDATVNDSTFGGENSDDDCSRNFRFFDCSFFAILHLALPFNTGIKPESRTIGPRAGSHWHSNPEFWRGGFPPVGSIVRLCPERGDDRGEIRAVGTYYGLLNILGHLARPTVRASRLGRAGRENCSYFCRGRS